MRIQRIYPTVCGLLMYRLLNKNIINLVPTFRGLNISTECFNIVDKCS